MLVVMNHDATDAQIEAVTAQIEAMGYSARPMPGKQRTTVGVVGNDGRVDEGRIQGMPGVRELIAVTRPYKQVSREWCADDTVVRLSNGTEIGGVALAIMAGPCAVEGEAEILEIAAGVECERAIVVILDAALGQYRSNRIGQRAQVVVGIDIVDRSLELLDREGFREYFDPLTGEGLGARSFSWSAALALDWLAAR